MPHYSTAAPPDFSAVADLIVAASRSPTTQCIHASTGEGQAALVAEMEKWHAEGEMVWLIGKEGNKIRSALGAEFDREAGRAWLRGPFGAISETAIHLWDHLQQALPEEILRYDTFLNAENNAGQAFYESRGFTVEGMVHVYTARREEFTAAGANSKVQQLEDAHRPALAALHDSIFPETSITGSQILAKLDETHRVWVYTIQNRVCGYLYGVQEPWSQEGYIEFLGVAENARGKGVGGALLQAALTWFFGEKDLTAVGLTVSSGNTNARALYERSGFKLQYTGVNQRFIRSS